MSGGYYGHGYERETSYVNAGYKQIKQVSRLDWWIRFWKILSQLFVLALCGIAIWVAYGTHHGWITWRMITVYWIVLTLKNACDFFGGRLKHT